MSRTTGYALICVAGVQLTAAACPALAAEEDTQLWTTLQATHTLTEGLEGSFEISPRFRGQDAGGDQFLTRALVDYRIAPAVTVGGGLAYVEFAGGNEFRPHQQINIGIGQVSFRTRLEERLFKGADRMELRLRQRVQLSKPLGQGTALSASGEIFGVVRPRSSGGHARVEQWRANLVVRHDLAPGVAGGLGYLLIVAPRDGAPDAISHVPQLTLTLQI